MRQIYTVATREKRDLERKRRENIDISVEVVRCVQSRPASTVYSPTAIRCSTEYTVLAGLPVHNGPPPLKFKIPPSQLRQRADRAAGLSVKGLWLRPKKLYTLEWKPPSVFVRPVVGECLSTLPNFVQKSRRE